MSSSVSQLIQTISEYIEVKTERIKLKIVSKSASIASLVLSLSVFLGIAFFLIFFLSFGLAFLLNDLLRSSYLGFLLVASFYLILSLVVLVLFKRKVIQGLFESLFIKLLDPDENESET